MADPRAQPGLQLPQHPVVLKDAARRDQGTAHHVCIRSRDAVFTYQSKVLERQGTGLTCCKGRHLKAAMQRHSMPDEGVILRRLHWLELGPNGSLESLSRR